MKNHLLIIAALLFPALCQGGGLSMEPSPQWRPLDDSKVASLSTELGATIVEASQYSEGGGGWVARVPATQPINKEYMQQAVAGYISGLVEKRQKLVKQEPVVVDRLKGVYVESAGDMVGYQTGMASFLLFTDREMYLISILGSTGISRDHPTTKSYLSRLRIDSSVVPGEIDKSAAYELGRQFGQFAVRFIFIGIFVSIVIFTIVVMIKRRKETQPPPLP